MGASLKVSVLYTVLLPASLLALIILLVNPFVFKYLMVKLGEMPSLSLEIGVRLGQISEFSLLIALVALNTGFITDKASILIQTATIITFMVSSYFIVMTYPTPIAVSDRLRRD